jgi:hypothetical protein
MHNECLYTDYEIYGDDRIVQTAQTKSRYSLESLFGIIFDVYMLAESDYLSCTFSSNVSSHTACSPEFALPDGKFALDCMIL